MLYLTVKLPYCQYGNNYKICKAVGCSRYRRVFLFGGCALAVLQYISLRSLVSMRVSFPFSTYFLLFPPFSVRSYCCLSVYLPLQFSPRSASFSPMAKRLTRKRFQPLPRLGERRVSKFLPLESAMESICKVMEILEPRSKIDNCLLSPPLKMLID